MTKPHRQQYGFGSFVKKITRPVKKIAKKVIKSPLGKAALLGGGLYGLGSLAGGGGGWGNFKALGSMFGKNRLLGQLIRDKKTQDISMGKLGLMGLLGAGATLPFLGGDEEEEVVEEGFDITPSSIANIRQMARDRDPSLAFLPPAESVMSGYYGAKEGGIARLANGGQPAEAQAEHMLRMEYQKYRNQGGTMSYQQFKMTVLQQAQQRGPMAQGQPQMAAQGGRVPAQEGGFVPLGGEERADDVPARLSKNEFVFTADAVRSAGGGDIDAGAEVMDKVMKNLEAGGQISEESQGAQGMYNNMKQLETRVA